VGDSIRNAQIAAEANFELARVRAAFEAAVPICCSPVPTRTLFRSAKFVALIVRSRFVGVAVLALASGARLSIALAAQRLDQGVELVFNHTYGACAYLHEAEPSGFYEIFVKCGLADAEPLQHLALSQDSLAEHMGSLRSHRDVRDFQRATYDRGSAHVSDLKIKVSP
jgi:hypothetical protein